MSESNERQEYAELHISDANPREKNDRHKRIAYLQASVILYSYMLDLLQLCYGRYNLSRMTFSCKAKLQAWSTPQDTLKAVMHRSGRVQKPVA